MNIGNMQQLNGHRIFKEKAFFITGTDTEVGKTCVAAAIAHAAEQAGLPWHYYKPAESGESKNDSDALRVRSWAGDHVTVGYHFDRPLAPLFAAEETGVELDLQILDGHFSALAPKYAPLIVEGAGGLLAPYTENVSALDLLKRWKLPVLLVAANRLGCLNHTLLSLKALSAAGAGVIGVIFNDMGNGASMERNPRDFVRFSSVPVLAWLPPLEKNARPSAAWLEIGIGRALSLAPSR